MPPVPAGTLNWTVLPITLAPNVCAGSVGGRTGAACAGSQAVVGAGVLIAGPTTTAGVPGGVHAGEAPDDRQAPTTHDESGPVQIGSPGPVQDGKQNEPVEVLTHFPFVGQVV